MARNKIIHNHGTTRLTSEYLKDNERLEFGELAINYNNKSPEIYIKKNDNTIATFEGDVEYTLEPGTPADGYAAEYHLEKNGNKVGSSINIPIADSGITYVSGDGISIVGNTISTSNAVVQGVNVNGVDATVGGKKATVTIKGSDINIGRNIDGTTITSNTKIDAALSELNTKINNASANISGGNGITISTASGSEQIISAKVVNANGLSVDNNGIKMSLSSENVPGTLKSCTISSFSAAADEKLVKASLNNGVLAIQVSDTIDGGTY